MKLLVIKNNGVIEPFNMNKIINAVNKALNSTNINAEEFATELANNVRCELMNIWATTKQKEFGVPEIQNMVMKFLMASEYKDTAIAYISYKHERDIKRLSQNDILTEVKKLLDNDNIDVQTENANKDANIIPTQRDLVAGIVSKQFALRDFFDKLLIDAHVNGDIHIHDLDYSPLFPSFNCMIVDLKNMLTHGFKMANAKIESPNSISVASNVTTQIIASVASHIYGGTTIGDIDIVLEPYVIKSRQKLERIAEYFVKREMREEFVNRLLEKEVYDAMQLIEYQVNSISTSNGQTPFVTIGFGLGTSPESKLIQKSILKVRMKGIGKDQLTPTFPKLVFALKDGHNLKPTDPFYDVKQLALECSSKRMYPDILSYDKVVEITGGFKYPMGCRSFLHEWKNENGETVHHGRNNMGVVSINLPRIALESDGCWEKFYEILDNRMSLAKMVAMTRIDRMKNVKANVAPILYTEGAMGVRLNSNDNVAELFKRGRASVSIGYIGLSEVMNIMEPNIAFNSESFKTKSVNVLKTMKQTVDEFTHETGYAFSVYGTPAESLCYRFARLDKQKFGNDLIEKDYYTNSFHLDVRIKVNPFDKIDFEKHYLPYTGGGSIVYSEFPNMKHNIAGLERVWDYAYKNVHYYGTNSPVDRCFDCGYEGEFCATQNGYRCPNCDNSNPKKFSVVRRICGYLGSVDIPFNYGKQQEIQKRVKHFGY
ncbi:anaerobic ribonucleoside-triphosphate reductase [Vibrio phage vB_VmeM-32]|nr:anaerobic ribonucleoside-triphosphate reductase [Vibrio phage vB_VmeM-32]